MQLHNDRIDWCTHAGPFEMIERKQRREGLDWDKDGKDCRRILPRPGFPREVENRIVERKDLNGGFAMLVVRH